MIDLIFLLSQAIAFIAPQGTVDDLRADRLAYAQQTAIRAEELPFQGPHAEERTAYLLDAVVRVESDYREDVERCSADRSAVGDDGHSIGLTQLFKGPNWFGHVKADICGDAELQYRLAIRVLTRARKACGGGQDLWLGAYNSGACRTTYASRRANREYLRLLAHFEIGGAS